MKVFTISYKGIIKGFRASFEEATDAVLSALTDRMSCMFLIGISEAKAADFSVMEREVEFGKPEISMDSVKKADDLYLEYGEVEVEDKKIVKDYYDGSPYIADVVTVGNHTEKHVIIHIADLKKDLTVEWSKEEIAVDDFGEWLEMAAEEILASLYEE